MTKQVIAEETPRATEQEADDTIREKARRWIEEHDDQMTGFSWRTPIDDESKGMWGELGEDKR
jgi:hypothetical protein